MPDNREIQTKGTPSVTTVTVLSGGQEVPRSYPIASVMVNKEVNRIPAATLIYQDGEASKQTFALSDTDLFIPGKEIEIKVGYGGKDESIFKGIVIRNSIKVRKNISLFTIECRDKVFAASITPQEKYYKDQKDKEVMEDILSAWSMQKEVGTTTYKHPGLVQYHLTDWDFLLERATANGLLIAIDDGKATIKAPDLSQQPAETIQYGSSLLELDLEMDARTQPAGLKSYLWDYASQQLTPVEAKEPTGTLGGNINAKDLAKSIKTKDTELKFNNKISSAELQPATDGMLQQARLSRITGRANFQGTPKIKPGNIVALKGVGKRFEGNAFVSGVRHQIVKGNWTTDIQIGFQPPVPAGPQAPASRITSLQVGVVTQLENDPEGEDRIKVTLPFINSKEDGMWARISTLDAGKQRGSFFRPEKNDEVLVSFIDGNPNYPVVLGGLNSSALPAPLKASDDNDEKGLVTRSQMKMIFNDKKKSFQLDTPSGKKFTLSEDADILQLEDEHGNKITMNSSGISIESPKDISFKATGAMTVEGKTADVKASMGFKADGGGGCELAAGNGMTSVKGGMVKIN
ncbi:type VI secretion system tip protein VgrG [Chitinophaga sp. G-6-1-13]|uniref:Type VI secretion system tip protein VgrG n=1 Tax=Chitinophaga fulva TaxID=2728842 RepID=A0A848GQC6_9BACT|nr:type VI secretion system tip protein VgrG [Chitinophaga fulva]NML40167.1 type VI secretion system tip protein VgrG [Chitinophaga fulva]